MAEKPGLKKERHWRRMLPNVSSLLIYFQEDKHKWQLVLRDIGLMISISNLIILLISLQRCQPIRKQNIKLNKNISHLVYKKKRAGIDPESKQLNVIKILAFLHHPIYDNKIKWSGLGPETPRLKRIPIAPTSGVFVSQRARKSMARYVQT